MKVKNLVLMALVATMGLVSCSKDEHEGVYNRIVTLKDSFKL